MDLNENLFGETQYKMVNINAYELWNWRQYSNTDGSKMVVLRGAKGISCLHQDKRISRKFLLAGYFKNVVRTHQSLLILIKSDL